MKKANKLNVGDEEDVGEIASRIVSAMQQAFSCFEKPGENEDSQEANSEIDGDTNIELSDNSLEEEKIKTRSTTASFLKEKDLKSKGYGPKAFGRELYKPPQDTSRGFINNLFYGVKSEITESTIRK